MVDTPYDMAQFFCLENKFFFPLPKWEHSYYSLQTSGLAGKNYFWINAIHMQQKVNITWSMLCALNTSPDD